MKTIQLMLKSRWTLVLTVLLIAVWCTKVDAAYWNRNRTQTHRQGADLDGDGIPNIVDPDIDNDGIPNALDKNIDGGIAKSGPKKGTYVGDRTDNDSPSEEDMDDDGLADDSLAEQDIDGDGKNDLVDEDIDGDGRLNDAASEADIDSDGRRNDDVAEMDDDGDGIDDIDDSDDNNDHLADIDDANHHNEASESEVQADLVAQPIAPSGSTVQITLQHYGTGSAKFVVEARDLGVGSYEVFVAGVSRGSVAVVQESNKTRGTLVFKTADSGHYDVLLNFPVAGQTVELRQGADVYFSATAPALPPSESGNEGSNSVPLTRGVGISNLAEAEVVMEFGTSGPTTLEINLQKVPAGNYSVVIGDATRGTLVVLVTAGGNAGDLHFEGGGSGNTLPLDFPSAGQPIAIIQDGTTFFFGQLPASAAP